MLRLCTGQRKDVDTRGDEGPTVDIGRDVHVLSPGLVGRLLRLWLRAEAHRDGTVS